MAEFLSPGVFVEEIDASTIAPTVSTSVGVFAGNFVKGPVGEFLLVTSVAELIDFYGLPTNSNYNEWYQAYNFLQYGNKLYVSRAANINGSKTELGVQTTTFVDGAGTNTVDVTSSDGLFEGQEIAFGDLEEVYVIGAILDDGLGNVSIQVDRSFETVINTSTELSVIARTSNGVAEAVINGGQQPSIGALGATAPYVGSLSQWEDIEAGVAAVGQDTKLKFVARNPGSWINNVEIAIGRESDFGVSNDAFRGVSLDGLFEYVPDTVNGSEYAIAIKDGDNIVETYIVSLDENARDENGKSAFIVDVINNRSSYVFVKDTDPNSRSLESYLESTSQTLIFSQASDSVVQADDLANAYELFDNKESVDIDIVIGNEIDAGVSAKNLVETRKDSIAFIGAEYADVVGAKASVAVSNLVTWRKEGNANFNSMFVVACGNYKYQYDRYNDKNRWINIAGDIAGLRAATSSNRASWFASAGLERGQIKNVKKLAFNPSQSQRDVLYKNSVNPICTFPGQGTVMWGQKTLLAKPSSFDRVNVRGLFNTLERSLSKMAKYQVMEFNDNFTRNRIVSMIKPFLNSVQAGRGIQDFLVVCDETNNTADVISRNQLVVDVYIKPTFVAEFIHLRFTNAGTNNFSEIVGG
jgi:hypothetical protein